MSTKRLTRSRQDRMLGGVCAGLGEYFGVDPTLVRLGFVALVFLGFGSPVAIYLLLWIIIPAEGTQHSGLGEAIEDGVAEITRRAGELTREAKARMEDHGKGRPENGRPADGAAKPEATEPRPQNE